MRANSPMRTFHARKVAYYERANWVAYYRKDWPTLIRVSVGMVKYGFGLAWWQAAYAAYLVARAEMAAAPFPVNDIETAERYMRRFYAFIQGIHHEPFDVERAAHLDVNWWVVHRELFGRPDKTELVDALTALYAEAYDVPAEAVRDAAAHRTQAMAYSDQWIMEGKQVPSLALEQELQELYLSYASLRAAVQKPVAADEENNPFARAAV